MTFSALGGPAKGSFGYPIFLNHAPGVPRLRALLLTGIAGATLLAGVQGAAAEGLTYVWTGAGNGTSYGKADNWELQPVEPAEGEDPLPAAPGANPPLSGDIAIITSGTPTITSRGRTAAWMELGGSGQFTLSNGSTFYVTDRLVLNAGGVIDIQLDADKGPATLTVDGLEMFDGTVRGYGNLTADSWIAQYGGDIGQANVETTYYNLMGGTLSTHAQVNGAFALLASELDPTVSGTVKASGSLSGGDDVMFYHDAGTMSGTVTGFQEYAQGSGLMDGKVTTSTYRVFGGTLSGEVDFSTLFSLTENGEVTANARLVAGDDATVLLTTDGDASLAATVTGDKALMVKEGSGTFTISGDVTLGALAVNAGKLSIGTGASTNTASFDSAVIEAGATLFVAKGATLTVRIPKNIINNGELLNEGTVYDDLDNAGLFMNDGAYIANVASNVSTINNNMPGVWTGNVKTNAGTINNNAGATWNGDIEANAGTINNSGIWLGDVITNVGLIRNYKLWTGDVLMNTYKDIHNIGAAAFWTGDVDNNSQVVNKTGATWTGKVLANNNVVFNFENSFWIGDVVANGGGENSLAQIDNYGDWAGAVQTNAGWIFNLDGTWTGNVKANTNGIYNNHLDVNRNPAGANAAAWVGDVESNAGTIVNNVGGTWTGNVLGNIGTIVNNGTWTGDFNNAGTVTAQGTIDGDFINSGILRVIGNLSGIDALTTTGTGSVDMRGGGAAQTLMVDSASFSSGSFFKIDVDDAGTSDLMVVAGTAQLAGTVRLAAASTPQVFQSRTDYTILTANLISGTFAAVSEDYAFLAARLSYTATAVNLALIRNDEGFVTAGTTSNQQGVAAVVEAFGAGDPLYDAIVQLNATGAAYAFDQLSGDAQTAIEGATLQGAEVFGDLGMARIDASFDALDDDVAPTNYVEGPAFIAPGGDTSGLWAQIYGARGTLDASGSTLQSSTGGVAGGLDGMLGDWRLGMMMQLGTTGSSIADRNTQSQSTDYGIGVYGGTKWGDTQVSLGGSFTRHDTDSTRKVLIGGFTDTLTANYASRTSQVFGQVSHEFDLGALSFRPYAGLSYVANATDGYSESGGAAAITSSANVIDATFANLGLGIDQQFVVGEDMLLTATASAGWRRAFADTPTSTHALAGGTSFSVVGTPIATDSVALNAGLSLDMTAQSLIDLTYDGLFGAGTETHAVKGSWSTRF